MTVWLCERCKIGTGIGHPFLFYQFCVLPKFHVIVGRNLCQKEELNLNMIKKIAVAAVQNSDVLRIVSKE